MTTDERTVTLTTNGDGSTDVVVDGSRVVATVYPNVTDSFTHVTVWSHGDMDDERRARPRGVAWSGYALGASTHVDALTSEGSWLIHNPGEDGYGAAYWSNTDGWVRLEDADTFSDEERESLRLPMGGYWVRAGVKVR